MLRESNSWLGLGYVKLCSMVFGRKRSSVLRTSCIKPSTERHKLQGSHWQDATEYQLQAATMLLMGVELRWMEEVLHHLHTLFRVHIQATTPHPLFNIGDRSIGAVQGLGTIL